MMQDSQPVRQPEVSLITMIILGIQRTSDCPTLENVLAKV